MSPVTTIEMGAGMGALLLASVHLFGGRFKRLRAIPRNMLLSAGSGVSIAYVFVHLLPEVAAAQEDLGEVVGDSPLRYLDRHAWLVALFGVVTFYGLELAARRSPRADTPDGELVGWVHIGSYGVYNAIVGYLLVERAGESRSTLVLFSGAMALHFLVNDHGLREHHRGLYRRRGRWVVAVAVLAGWWLGTVTDVAEARLGTLIAFLAGGVVMNVFKEELPEDRRSRWGPLLVGAAGYAALLLMF